MKLPHTCEVPQEASRRGKDIKARPRERGAEDEKRQRCVWLTLGEVPEGWESHQGESTSKAQSHVTGESIAWRGGGLRSQVEGWAGRGSAARVGRTLPGLVPTKEGARAGGLWRDHRIEGRVSLSKTGGGQGVP